MIIYETDNVVNLRCCVVIDYGLVTVVLNNDDIVPLPCDPRDIYEGLNEGY